MSDILIIGAGLQGSACAHDLAIREGFSVTVADCDPGALEHVRESLAAGSVETIEVDVRERPAMRSLMARHRAVVSAVPYFFNFHLASDALEAGVHFTDMGGNTELVLRELELDERARRRGISIVPDMGLAPGLANLLAAHSIERFDEVDEVRIRVGGLPVEPQPPLGYILLFSMHGLVNEYMGEALVLRGGEVESVPCFGDVEILEIPGVGRLEAFATLGGISTLPYTYRNRVREMDYRTLRYPGHYERMKCMIELGLLDEEPVEVEGGRVRPRDVFVACAEPRLTHVGARDLVVVHVLVRGSRKGSSSTEILEILDHGDPELGHSAMMRTTAYPVAIVSAMQVREEIEPGARPAEVAVPLAPFRERLAVRGIRVATS